MHKRLVAVSGTRTLSKRDLRLNDYLPHIEVDAQTYEVRADGQFDVVWKSPGAIPGEAWSRYLPADKDIVADWVTLKCGNYNKATKACSGQNYK